MIGQSCSTRLARHADVPVVEVDGRVAMARDQADLVADVEPVGGGRDGEAAVLVGDALVGRGGLVGDERRVGIEGQRLEAGQTKRLGSKALVGAPSWSRLRP